MGSIQDTKPVEGEFMLSVVTPTSTNGDAWARNYYAPPKIEPHVPRRYPLHDVRPMLSNPAFDPHALLRTHGFTIVNHHSAFLDRLDSSPGLPEDAIAKEYLPEMEALIKSTLGARHVVFGNVVFRRGTSEPFSVPTKATFMKDAETKPDHKLANQEKVGLSKPIRVPHIDHTPLGLRQFIRKQESGMLKTATELGIIAREDAICEGKGVDAMDARSVPLMFEKYNEGGLGPRYAAYSVWRPLKKVERDPISVCPRKREVPEAPGKGLVHWPYDNKLPGAKELGGDYLKEYAFLGVENEKQTEEEDKLKWYYVSEQERDEVMFIQMCDSASLGKGSEQAGGVYHASPDIKGLEEKEPRESIELRVTVFW